MELKVTNWAVLSMLALGIAGCGGGHDPAPRAAAGPAVPVRVETVESSRWAEELRVTASVFPLRRAEPGTVLLGRVEELLRQEGDRVRRGDVLARVESREVTARLAQAEAGLAAARAHERNALRMKERMERLHGRQAASQKNLDDALAAHDAAVANTRAAEEGIAAARMYVSYAEITAPFDGVVVQKLIEAGDTASPGQPLFVIEDISTIKIEAQIPESVIDGLKISQTVEVEVAGERLLGELAEILPAADPRSRTFTVRILLDNAQRRLRSGMFARLILGGPERQAISVLETAIVRRGPLTGVFVVGDEGLARLRWITLGRSRDGRVEVLTGLQVGERFVAEPAPALRDGSRVEVSG
jgi:RND family efflux transporter MFP subunit